jgi:hypothetical protein
MALVVLPGDYRPGAIVSADVPSGVGQLAHKGVVTECIGPDGYPTVIHASHHFGRVVETTMSVFAKRAVGPVRAEGYPGPLYASEVLARARARIGQPWKARQNCEHFVTGVHGLLPFSPQLHRKVLEAGFTVAPALASAWAVRRALRKRVV